MSPYLISGLEAAPAVLHRIVNQIPVHKHGDRLSKDRFSLSEMVAHVADMEEVFQDRIRLAHEAPGSAVQGIDPDERAKTHHYSDKNIFHELEVFENRRRDTLDTLRNLTDEDFKKTVVHPEFGTVSIRTLAENLIGHDLYHLDQASAHLK